MVPLILHLEVGQVIDDDCLEEEISSISPATVDQEENSTDCKGDGN